jgi:hypothetical protein
MIERYHIKERNDITQPREEKRKINRGIDPNTLLYDHLVILKVNALFRSLLCK